MARPYSENVLLSPGVPDTEVLLDSYTSAFKQVHPETGLCSFYHHRTFHPERRICLDGKYYTEEEFHSWYSVHGARVWNSMKGVYAESVSLGHSHSATEMLLFCKEPGAQKHAESERRIAWDGHCYTEEEFNQWYGLHSQRCWNEAEQPTNVLRLLQYYSQSQRLLCNELL